MSKKRQIEDVSSSEDDTLFSSYNKKKKIQDSNISKTSINKALNETIKYLNEINKKSMDILESKNESTNIITDNEKILENINYKNIKNSEENFSKKSNVNILYNEAPESINLNITNINVSMGIPFLFLSALVILSMIGLNGNITTRIIGWIAKKVFGITTNAIINTIRGIYNNISESIRNMFSRNDNPEQSYENENISTITQKVMENNPDLYEETVKLLVASSTTEYENDYSLSSITNVMTEEESRVVNVLDDMYSQASEQNTVIGESLLERSINSISWRNILGLSLSQRNNYSQYYPSWALCLILVEYINTFSKNKLKY